MALTQFDPSLISRAITRRMPEGFVLRPLEEADYDKGYLDCLGMLTYTGQMSRGAFARQFHYHRRRSDECFYLVVENVPKKLIVGCISMFIEQKYIHSCGSVAHIEDLVTHKDYRNFHFGMALIEAVKLLAKSHGCYKLILDCADRNVPFYEKCGLKRKENVMAIYMPENEHAHMSKL